jgi:serine/threonine-protein kinase
VETDSFGSELQSALAPAYTIQRELTGGGMSRVFVALEHALGRTVVVKVLKPELGAGMNRERFRREIMLAAQLQHPHIVPVLSAGEHGELLWYTMPFVEGVSLRDSLVHMGKFSPRTVTRVLHDVLDALAYAHRRGVIHRDIKPGNILHHGSHSLVTDFGVAKALSASLPHSGTTSVGIAIGTPAYMAPEQLAADPNADHRMDLYAVGLLAYELLTGVQPFSGSSPQATMAAQLTRMPTPLEECCPGVPPELARLITRLLAKHPDDRPATAGAALAELEDLATPSSVSGGGASSGESMAGPSSGATSVPVSRSRRPRRAVAIGVALVALAAAGIALALTRNGSSAKSTAPAAVSTSAAPARTDSAAAAPSVRLTHDDSLRIAEAVRAQMAKARLSGTPVPNGGRAMDSLRRTLTRAYTDSALRGTPVVAAVPNATPPRPPQLPRSVASRPPTRSTTPAPKPPVFARPRRVAILPVRDATLRADVAPTTHAVEDSLRKAVIGMGYNAATDSELLRLLSQPDLNVQRRVADSLGIGAIVMTILSTRGDEIVAQTIVLDVWRNYPFSDRTATDLDKPQEALGVVRNVSRALERVSWRTRADPKLVLVFDLENQTGSDSLTTVARQLSDSLRGLVSSRFGARVVTDSAARATREVMERRATGARVGAGAIVAGSLYRARGDSVTLRLSTRDLSEDKTLPNIEIRLPRSELLTSFQVIAQRVLADLAQVNWGPKASR